jgi:putative ABC transport system ATP-binding protein
MPTPLVSIVAVSKRYRSGGQETMALKDISLEIQPNKKVVIMGPSGSGKSTMLQIIGALDRPSEGTVTVAGQDITALSDDRLSVYRNKTIGFIFQTFNLQTHLNALENVALPLVLGGASQKHANHEAATFLELVGLSEKAARFPSQLSGGEMQRVAIARALVNRPAIILADEPTANLDKDNAETVLTLMSGLKLANQALIIVTHDDRVAKRFDYTVHLENGEVVEGIKH